MNRIRQAQDLAKTATAVPQSVLVVRNTISGDGVVSSQGNVRFTPTLHTT